MANSSYDGNPLEDILVEGLSDFIYERWVLSVATDTGVEDLTVLRALSLGLIAEMLSEQLATPGKVKNGEFVPWEMSPGDAMMKITRTWISEWPDEPPTPGSVVWLQTTPKANDIARAVLRREGYQGKTPGPE